MARWILWSVFTIVWTIGLELPIEPPESMPVAEVIITNRKIIAKTSHVAIYAAWTALTPLVPVPSRYRWLLMFFLMAHAWGSEMLQVVLEPICHRGGSLTDVGLDVLGILIGPLIGWRWWTRE